MRTAGRAVLGLAICLQPALAAAQNCHVQGDPQRLGKDGFIGQQNYTFDYWSDAGLVNGEYQFQPGVRNLGDSPLTVDWKAAEYFRRGIPARKDAPRNTAPGECDSDRNPLNTSRGDLLYGPNANFTLSSAPFYVSQSPRGRASRSIDAYIEWNATLEGGATYLAAVAIAAVPSGNSIRYSFTNKGRPVEIEWPGVLTPGALAALQQRNPPAVRTGRLVMTSPEPIQIELAATVGNITSVVAPLSIYIPNGLLLYRDRHRGLVPGPPGLAQ